MATSYVEALSEDFTPGQFRDNYREALTELVDAKVAGREITAAAPAEAGGNVLDLMEALRASVDAAKRDRIAGAQ